MEDNKKVIQSAALNEREYLHKIFPHINGIKTDMRITYTLYTQYILFIFNH